MIVSFASTAQAAPRMYSASLIVETFGNDTTTGSVFPYSAAIAEGIPLVGECNTAPYHAKETLTFPTIPYYTQVFTFTIPTYGGHVPDVDTNGDTVPDIVSGCGAATRRVGNPLVGSGSLVTTGDPGTSRTSMNPRAFALPQGAISRVATASRSASGRYLFEIHRADLRNQSGQFFAGGGDGSLSVAHAGNAGTRMARQVAGPNRFGGVMRLLGSYDATQGYHYADFTLEVRRQNWLLDHLGAGGQDVDASGRVTAGHVASALNYGYTTFSAYPITSTVYVEAFKWTTGTVQVTARSGPFPTIIERRGHDLRTPMGAGEVQLVSPMLTYWDTSTHGDFSTAGIGVVKIHFAPEPSGWLILGSGVTTLGLMARRRSSHARR